MVRYNGLMLAAGPASGSRGASSSMASFPERLFCARAQAHAVGWLHGALWPSVCLVACWGFVASTHAMSTTAMGETIEWFVSGVADSVIVLVDRPPNADDNGGMCTITYAAHIQPGQRYRVSMRMIPKQTNELYFHRFTISIPSYTTMVDSEIMVDAGEQFRNS